MTEGKRPATAFVVAPNLAVTASHVLDYLREDKKLEEQADGSMCFGDGIEDCKQSLSIGRVVFKGKAIE
jgi:hypothetical protein